MYRFLLKGATIKIIKRLNEEYNGEKTSTETVKKLTVYLRKTFNFIFNHISCHFHVRKSCYGRGYIHVCVSLYFILLWKFNDKIEKIHILRKEKEWKGIFTLRDCCCRRCCCTCNSHCNYPPPPPTPLACSYWNLCSSLLIFRN